MPIACRRWNRADKATTFSRWDGMDGSREMGDGPLLPTTRLGGVDAPTLSRHYCLIR